MSFALNAVTGGSAGGLVTQSTDFTLAYVGIAVVFVLGLAGSLLPPLIASYFPAYQLLQKVYFKFFSGFAAGLVLSVGFVHAIGNAYVAEFQGLVPNYFDSSTEGYMSGSGSNATFVPVDPSDYSTTQTYNWTGFIAMMGALITFSLEELILSRIGGHSHGEPMEMANTDGNAEKADETGADDARVENAKLLTDMWTLWLGLSFHSIFVGLALGFSPDYSLFSAIVAHQFFEGVGLGARVARASISKRWQIWLVDFAYAVTAPIGIAIGVGASSSVDPAGSTFNIADMVIDGLAAGILIYVSLVHMIKGEMSRHDNTNRRGRAAMFLGILLGAATMSIIGIWA